MGFGGPRLALNGFPESWVQGYAQEGLRMRDTALRWCFVNEGIVRWEDLPETGPDSVQARAAAHGLTHGFSCALVDGLRSIGGFARADRPFTPEENEAAVAEMRALHAVTAEMPTLPEPLCARIRKMGIAVRQG
ncbi:autoinducer binding domain-containing protein [Limimaricola pyoseonensis]|nr:autoinducer binding domain-containing protein [Limimaricola pyoseonensis]